jgi:hypothetical protein
MKALQVFAVIAVMLASVGMSYAANGYGDDLRNVIRERHIDQLNCNAQYAESILSYLGARANDTGLLQEKDGIASAIAGANASTGSEYAKSVERYRSAIKGGLKAAISTRASLAKNAKKDDENSSDEINGYIRGERETFRSCFVDATRKRVSAEVHLMQNISASEEGKLDRLDARNISTAGARAVLADIDAKTGEMESAISGMDNETQIQQTKDEYMGQIRHLWIEYSAEKLDAAMARAEAIDPAYAAKFSDAKSLIREALSFGSGTSLTVDQYADAKRTIDVAAKSINDALRQPKPANGAHNTTGAAARRPSRMANATEAKQ